MARTEGAKSYANIRIQDLMQAFSENTIVPVSRVWLRNMNIQLTESSASLQGHAEPTTPPPAVTEEEKEAVLAGVSESDVSSHT